MSARPFSRVLLAGAMLGLLGGLDAPPVRRDWDRWDDPNNDDSPNGPRASDRDNRTPEDIAERRAKHAAKLARRAKRAGVAP